MIFAGIENASGNIKKNRVHSLAVHMMDNASALPTCAQQQQQRKLLLIKID